MKYLVAHSQFEANSPFVVDGKKQELRRARRSGSITARQQQKQIKAARRMAKLAMLAG